MTWFKVDDGFWRSLKIGRISRRKKVRVPLRTAAAGAWVLSGSWSGDQLADGWVPLDQIEDWDPDGELTEALIEVGLWERDELEGQPGVRFHDWSGWQPVRADVEKKRALTRDRVKKFRERKAAEGPPDAPPPAGTRPGNTDGNALQNALVTPPPTRPDPTRTKTTTSRTAHADADERFAAFWDAYPRKVDKQAARRAWNTAVRTIPNERLITAARAYGATLTELRYAKYPATWLNAGSYDNEPEPARLAIVRDPLPAAPDEALAALRDRAEAQTAANLIGALWIAPPQPPGDRTPPQQYDRDRRIEWIDQHADAILAALTHRETG